MHYTAQARPGYWFSADKNPRKKVVERNNLALNKRGKIRDCPHQPSRSKKIGERGGLPLGLCGRPWLPRLTADQTIYLSYKYNPKPNLAAARRNAIDSALLDGSP